MTLLLFLGAWSRVTLGVAAEPTWGDLAQLGTYALALVAGYYGCHRLQVLHERAMTAIERTRADQEREERKEAEARERKLGEAALPALQEAVRAVDRVNQMLDRQSRP